MKWLIVGLGNPEGKYFRTYHNLGFLAVDEIATRHSLEYKKKGNQMTAGLPHNGNMPHAILLKPLTYMNRSGEAVVAITRKSNLPVENIIVIYDDLYIDKGKIRITRGGSHAGHNGIRSINALLPATNYIRIKVGIKPEREPHCMANYVLSKITSEEVDIVRESIELAADAAFELIDGIPLERVQAKYNCRNDDTPKLREALDD